MFSKKPIKCWGTSIFLSVLIYCLHRTLQFMAISWTSTGIPKPFLCLNLTRNQQEIIQGKHFPILIIIISIITQVIIEILMLSLAENGVIFLYNHLRRGDYSGRTNFQNSHLALCQCIWRGNLLNENAIPRNTKHATKFGMTLFKGKMWKLC